MSTYEVWVEGYIANGDKGSAWLKGKYPADSFKEACEKAFDGDSYYDGHTYWGCRLFDNEADARKSFG